MSSRAGQSRRNKRVRTSFNTRKRESPVWGLSRIYAGARGCSSSFFTHRCQMRSLFLCRRSLSSRVEIRTVLGGAFDSRGREPRNIGTSSIAGASGRKVGFLLLSTGSHTNARVAQLVEHSTDTRAVVGSTPTACTNDVRRGLLRAFTRLCRPQRCPASRRDREAGSRKSASDGEQIMRDHWTGPCITCPVSFSLLRWPLWTFPHTSAVRGLP